MIAEHELSAGGKQRLTNILWADDIMLYAKSLDELIFIMESLVHQLAQGGLLLSSSKPQIFIT